MTGYTTDYVHKFLACGKTWTVLEFVDTEIAIKNDMIISPDCVHFEFRGSWRWDGDDTTSDMRAWEIRELEEFFDQHNTPQRGSFSV